MYLLITLIIIDFLTLFFSYKNMFFFWGSMFLFLKRFEVQIVLWMFLFFLIVSFYKNGQILIKRIWELKYQSQTNQF